MVINFDISTAYEQVALEKRTEKKDDVLSATKFINADEYTAKIANMNDDKTKYVNLPTKKYIDAVIKSALKNIEMGVNVDENKRVINIFSNIVNETPTDTMKISCIA